MSLQIAFGSPPDVLGISSIISSYAAAYVPRNACAAPVSFEMITPIPDMLSAASVVSIVPLLTHATKRGILRWRARAAEEYREPAMVLKLLPITPTATSIPHIHKRFTAYGNIPTILKTLPRMTAEHMMLRYGEIERLCEATTAYYRPYAKHKLFARLFREAYKRTGIHVWWANTSDNRDIPDPMMVVKMGA
jgi:hypothetical protein